MTISVSIIEDDAEVANQLIDTISKSNLLQFVGHASNRWQAIQMINKEVCDVFLLDIGLPDVDGLDLIDEIRAKSLEAKIIMVTSFSNSKQILKSFKLGANGYILKHEATKDLERKIIQSYNGGIPLSPEIPQFLLNRIEQLEEGGSNSVNVEKILERFHITKAEWKVLQLLISGLSINEIALRLNNSPHTINQHLRSIYKKLGVSSRSQAVSIAINNGLNI
jgi:DNA-binding NarL/FixJ family response regulator